MKIEINVSDSEIQEQIKKQLYKNITHKHIWESVKNSSDVKCKICGIRAMRSQAEANDDNC